MNIPAIIVLTITGLFAYGAFVVANSKDKR